MTQAKALGTIRNFEPGSLGTVAFGKRNREGLEYYVGHGSN